MTSGRIPATVEAMMRAFGLRPSAAAFSSDMTSTAAAPSLSGHALPAVTVPPSLNTGFSDASFSSVVPGRGPSSFVTTVSGHVDLFALLVHVFVRWHRHRNDFLVEVARLLCGHGAGLGDQRPLVLGLTTDFAFLGYVLGGHTHRDVDVVEEPSEPSTSGWNSNEALPRPALETASTPAER